MNQDFAIVILAAGLGTRMKSRRAKVLHRAGGKTLIELVVSTATQVAAPDRVHVVVGHQAELVQQAVAVAGVRTIVQSEQLGTGHAVLEGRSALESAGPHLLVLYGDCPLVAPETLAALMRQHLETGAAATVLTTRLADPAGYGRMIRDRSGHIQAIVEEKAATPEQKAVTEINSGIYCFQTPRLFECLARLRPDNAAGEYYLTDVIGDLASQGRLIGGFSICESWQVLGINTRVELAEVDAVLRGRKARALMLDGVTIQRPETVTLDLGVSVGSDTVLEPFVQVLGRSAIGSGCLVRSYSVVSDSTLADEVTVEPFSLIHESQIERGARIGPYARLRTGNYVGAEARVGNFVELKKTRIGARSKAQHLAYLGDADIGAGVNIGAGTITCNYDGLSKHPTTIGDGVFVGSNTTLVAPVEIGAGSYVAAGSVVTENVPPDTLTIARSRQTNKRGWPSRRSGRGRS
ncbi:MAG TPA: bifunctional UDP-N-acetylglucosamine diphosphorylase/glucosamine-1-phosphate N-acetyltransferase GlmU [Bryobacterales bacterium]|nr:bifunctional UDP-N-acetylglucosamine diphosphorylase/glucosamine-1-phosphate N-acetyltransferase GlmU [Bryobacterales bacterium]